MCAVLEDTLATVLRVPVRLTVAGRTDAGVHATGQVCHADVPSSALATRSLAEGPDLLVGRLAKMLPDDVRIKAVTSVSEDFDARFSALRRHYEYRLTDARFGAEPVVAVFSLGFYAAIVLFAFIALRAIWRTESPVKSAPAGNLSPSGTV